MDLYYSSYDFLDVALSRGNKKIKVVCFNALHLEIIFISRGLRQIETVVFKEGNPIKTFHTSI